MDKERRNLYRILQVQPEAPPAVLKASYRALMSAGRVHPDLGGDTAAAAAINRAYEVLSDPDERARYDRTLQRPRGPSVAGPASATAPAAAPLDPALWNADAKRPFCPFCRQPLGLSAGSEDACGRCDAPLRLPPTQRHARPELIGRRRDPRVQRSDQALMRLPGDASDYRVLVQDLSFSGIGMEVGVAVREGSAVRVLAAGFDAVVLVLGCQRARHGYSLHGRLLTMRLLRQAGTFVSTTA